MIDLSRYDLNRRSHVKAAIVALIKDGATIAQAADATYTTLTNVEKWLYGDDPAFARRVLHARRVRRECQRLPIKRHVLELIRAGHSARKACRLAGTSDQTMTDWRKDDPAFDREFRAALGPTGRVEGRKAVMVLDALHAGASIPTAAMEAGLHPSTVYRWRDRFPHLWAEIEDALQAVSA